MAMNASATVETLTRGRRIGSPHGVKTHGGRSSESGTSAGGETLSLRSTFCQLGFLERERRDVWRLLASFFARSFYTSAGIAQLVEHNLAKVGVAGSNPVSRFISLGSRRHRSSKWRPLAGSVGWLVLLRSGGEIGRREGLKIP